MLSYKMGVRTYVAFTPRHVGVAGGDVKSMRLKSGRIWAGCSAVVWIWIVPGKQSRVWWVICAFPRKYAGKVNFRKVMLVITRVMTNLCLST